MSSHEYKDTIKSFNTIRAAMREYFVYGFRAGKEIPFGKESVQRESFNRLKSWLNDYAGCHEDGKKRYYLSVDSRQEPHNPLFRAWKSKSFSDKDIMLHFLIFDALYDDTAALTGKALADHVQRYYEIDEKLIRLKLDEYIAEGMIQKTGGRRPVYSRVPDVRLPSPDFLDCFSEIAPCGVLGSALLDRQGIAEAGGRLSGIAAPPERDSRFRFKHHFITGTMDSEVLFRLFQAMREEKEVSLRMFSGDTHTVVPLRIRCSAQDGRQYVMAAEDGEITYFRLNQIRKAELGETRTDFAALREKMDSLSPHFWGASTRGQDSGLKKVEFSISFDAKEKKYIPGRLEREKRCGTVTQSEDSARFSADVYDPRAMFPWLRTFFCRITELSLPGEALHNAFLNDFASLCAQYDVPTKLNPAEAGENREKETFVSDSKNDNARPSLFNEVYSEDFNVVSTILQASSGAPISSDAIDSVCRKLAFDNQAFLISGALKLGADGQQDRDGLWPLLRTDGIDEKGRPRYHSRLEHPPTMPATLLQRQWLKAVLQDPRAALFREELTETEEALKDIEPLFRQEDIEFFDAYGDGDPYSDETYRKNFRTALQALREGKNLKLEVIIPGGRKRFWRVEPEHLEYSEKDDKFRLITKQNITVNMGTVCSCELLEPGSALSGASIRPVRRELVIELTDIHNALERALLQFAHFEKRTEQADGENRYRITVTYDGADETDLVIRALSFGSNMQVMAPASVVEEIRSRLRRQAVLFGLAAEN